MIFNIASLRALTGKCASPRRSPPDNKSRQDCWAEETTPLLMDEKKEEKTNKCREEAEAEAQKTVSVARRNYDEASKQLDHA